MSVSDGKMDQKNGCRKYPFMGTTSNPQITVGISIVILQYPQALNYLLYYL